MVLDAERDSGVFAWLEIALPAVAPSEEHFSITPIPYIALAAHVPFFYLALEPKSPVFKINSCGSIVVFTILPVARIDQNVFLCVFRSLAVQYSVFEGSLKFYARLRPVVVFPP